MIQQIVLRQIDRPVRIIDSNDLDWFCSRFGIDNGRDLDNIATRVILSLLERLPENEGVPVEEIATDLEISSPRVNYHIRNLVETGLVYRHKQRIYIRGSSLRSMVREIRKDTIRILDDLEEVAGELDEAFGINEEK